jgi:hypothetical protein
MWVPQNSPTFFYPLDALGLGAMMMISWLVDRQCIF